jgi:Fe2+ transport system protein FeoA
VKQKPKPEFEVLEGRCAGPQVCPLSHIKTGAVVCIRHLSTTPDVTNRLRELGFCEDQKIRLVARQSNYICQVCNARLAISGKLAESIMVEAVPAPQPHFAGTTEGGWTGVRPSSGAATSASNRARGHSVVRGGAEPAAPEDGRTPVVPAPNPKT